MRRVQSSGHHIGVSACRLKSSLVNTSQASCSERSESVARYRRTTYRLTNMKSLFLCLLMMSILIRRTYQRRQPGAAAADLIARQRQRLPRREAPPRPPRSACPFRHSASVPAAARAAHGCLFAPAPQRESPALQRGRGPAAPRHRRSDRRARPEPQPSHRHARSASSVPAECRTHAAAATQSASTPSPAACASAGRDQARHSAVPDC